MTPAAPTTRRGALRGEVLAAAVAVVLVAAGVGAIFYAVGLGGGAGGSAGSGPAATDPAATRTDPNLVVCEELRGGFATGLAESRALAAGPDGLLYVSGDSAVRAFDANGTVVRQVALPAPAGPLAVEPDGRLYVASGGRVLVVGPGGDVEATWAAPDANALITAVAVADSGVYVADAARREVRRYDRSGRLLATIGRKDPDRHVPGLIVPSPYLDLAAGPDGLLRLVNPGRRRVEAYTPAGDFEGAWGGYAVTPDGFTGCCNPSNIALYGVDAAARRFGGFVTAEKGITRVKLYDAGGRFVGIVAGPESFRRHDEILSGRPAGGAFCALDVAVDARGRIAVLDPMTNEVRFFRRRAPGGGAR